jgi:hypothetical protein
MEKRQFKFKKEYFQIKGIHNIPGLIICSGFGYDLKTYCCKTCGEIFVIDGQLFKLTGYDLIRITNHKSCPTCGTNLDDNLVSYPENVFYKGTVHLVVGDNNSHSDEPELIAAYEITK